MRNTDWRAWLQRGRSMLVGALLGLYLCSPAYAAFTPSSAPLLSSAAVTPNVMLLVDNSGSMNNLIRSTAFDQTVTRAPLYICARDDNCNTISLQDMDNENLLLSSLYKGGCSTGYYGFYRYTSSNSGSRVCLKLPDPVGSEGTRYSTRYLSYLISLLSTLITTKDYTDGSIPTDYRVNVARTVSSALVTANRSLRMGLATFNAPSGSDRGPGGYISRAIADLQATTNTTSAQATTNYNNLLTSIGALKAEANTPLAETYYEITRYFRGLAPYYNSSPSTYTSPIQYRCQRNFGVVITDGLPTYDRTFPSNDPAITSSNTLPNWDNKNNDGDDLNGDGEGDTLYLDDIAKFAYDIDMRTTGTDAAGKSWNDSNFQQNLYTYTVGFTAANQMLSDTATYGHGRYYQATDSATLTTALTQALNEISSQAGSGGGGTTASSTTYNANYYYNSQYDPADWSGTVQAFAFASDGTLATTPTWTTDTKMKVGSADGTFQSWDTSGNKVITLAYQNFSTAQKTVLTNSLANLSTRNTTGVLLTGSDLIEWLKGTNPTGLKTRTKLLGDVIDSPVVLASATTQTASDLTGDTSYSTYLNTKASNMINSILVNANDGLTNVIKATDGSRRYAYLPSTTLPSLSIVEDPTYINGTTHKFLNDGPLAVFDSQINGAWKTIAFGGTGAAAKAFYAIQLFDATPSNTVQALWEIRAPDTASTSNSFNDLGYAYAKPEVARLPDGTWAAFIGNGYGSNSGVAALYVVNIADGSLIKKIVIDSTETDNGLSAVKLVVNASNVVQAAYGGDLKGRLWKFDLSGTSTSNWGLAFSGRPLFTTPGGAAQPITAQPLVTANATSGYMVYFGTGKFLETTDKTSTTTQAFYAVWDAAGGAGNFSQSNLQAQSITGAFTASGNSYLTVSQNAVDYTSKKGWYLPLTYNNTLVGERVIYQAAYTRGRIVFTTAGVDTSDPCSSQGFGRLIELDATTGNMLTYPVIDTNGDGVVNSSDLLSAGMTYNSIPTLNGIVSDDSSTTSTTTSGTDTKVVQKSDKTTISVKEAGGRGTGSRRIMWRQVQ
ncbi:PilC/PilY family type IV pilus protein [Pseudomonas sp. RIT-PI-S]|uniref:pilus assembly protein n=1 Tax=Pseudomonas sp. RIT-PI-S TaxID=3035295 RepID=UPI0021D7F9F0|nr:PilC/PilY family type IV pilus protein [Pseudomonas sp. RIT-PI-S]